MEKLPALCILRCQIDDRLTAVRNAKSQPVGIKSLPTISRYHFYYINERDVLSNNSDEITTIYH
jgi:hypothetical protein